MASKIDGILGEADMSEEFGIDVKIKSLLYAFRGTELRADETAAFLDAPERVVIDAMERLCNDGVLKKDDYLECPECGMLNDVKQYRDAFVNGTTYECSDCAIDLSRFAPRIVSVYRRNLPM